MKRRKFLENIALASCSIPLLSNSGWLSQEAIKPMEFRSLSFHGFTRGQILDKELVKVGAKVGFNDVTIQDDFSIYRFDSAEKRKSYKRDAVNYLTKLKQIFQENGYLEFLKEQGLTLSSWLHELDNYDESWGPVTLDNDVLWGKLTERYQKALGEIFPELDNVILTVTESQRYIVQPELLEKLVGIVNQQCKANNMNLILRTFSHNIMQSEGIVKAIEYLPDDVTIMSKSIPQDWGLRGIHNPLIGNVSGKKQYVEVDTWGENASFQHVANCRIYSEFKPQFDHWNKNDIQGLSVRVTRDNTSVLNNAQEANVWFLGYATSGKSSDPDKAIYDFSENKFGSGNRESMARVLKDTGFVVAEAMYVKEFSFGKPHFRNPISVTTRGPYIKRAIQPWYVIRPSGPKTAAPYEQDEDFIHASPFNHHWDPQNWDKSYYPDYLRVRKGDPIVIHQEKLANQKALAIAEAELVMLECIKNDLQKEAYQFFNFKLKENKYVLIFMGELQLAWLKAERSQYTDQKSEIPGLISEIHGHLEKIEKMYEEVKSEHLEVVWQGRNYELTRFGAYDIPDTLSEFRRFWKL